jgi:haloalkane dehalogenase
MSDVIDRVGTRLDRPVWLDTDAWPFQPRQLRTSAGDVAVVDVGDGPTLLLVHVGFWSFIWRSLLLELAPQFRCIAIDAPGSGLSKPADQTTLDCASQAIGEVMGQLTTPFVLVAHDLGGVPALDAAASRAEAVRGLVLVNSFGWRPSGVAFRSMLGVMGSAAMREADAWTGFLPAASSTRFGVGRNLSTSERAAFRAGVDREKRRSFHRYMRSARKSDGIYARVADALDGPLGSLPMMTIFGARNDPLRFQPKWKERFPSARQVVVPRGNHFPMCDAPQLVGGEISDWYEKSVRAD